tara:strand:+ start:257 stop:1729 length:1473 start_codon:yes stop_codon:yes gene_type:complete
METKNSILSFINKDSKTPPYSFIFSELQKPSLIDYNINPNVRRIVREWFHFYNETNDEINKTKMSNIQGILCNSNLNIFINNRAVNIPATKIKTIYEEYGPQFIVSLINSITNGSIDFPYKKYSISDTHLNTLITNTKNFKGSELVKSMEFNLGDIVFSELTMDLFPNPFKLVDDYQYFKHTDKEYLEIDLVTDYFTEDCRMKSIRADQKPVKMSPYDIWKSGNNLVKDVLLNSLHQSLHNGEDFNMNLLREEIYNSSSKPDGIKESTQFKVSLAMSVIKYFCHDPSTSSMLDISAGWGDRLIAAASCGLEHYFACDPNDCLKEGHEKIKDYFIPTEKKHLYEIKYEPFESATLPDKKYDLVFSSPPFFDLEEYSNESNQSLVNYKDGNNWLVNFLFVSLEKAWSKLEVGGHMAIHITDTPTLKICEPMVLFCQAKLPGFSYMGVLGSLGKAGHVRPIWVFKKTSKTSSGLARDAKKSLKNNFKDISSLI